MSTLKGRNYSSSISSLPQFAGASYCNPQTPTIIESRLGVSRPNFFTTEMKLSQWLAGSLVVEHKKK